MTAAVAPSPRPRCDRCRRPVVVCYCASLPRLETRTKVVILQHPRERDVAIGTARMASLCLPSAELHVGVRWNEHAALGRALADPARPPILLYPGEGAKDILREPPPGPVTLVVVDGTWTQAKNVVRDNPVLQALPRYAFVAPEPSHYRIRKEPSDEYVSTIEAVMHVLGALEGDPARFRALLDPFHAMVDAQLAWQQRTPRARWRRPRPPGVNRPRVPDELATRWGDLVCVVGEANAWPYLDGAPQFPDELVHWVAERVATGERFDVVAAPDQPLSPSTSFHIGLDEPVLRAGGTRAALLAGFAGFVRSSDILCAWGHHSAGLLAGAGGVVTGGWMDVRASAQRYTNSKLGSLESYAATFGPPGDEVARGRRRLAGLVQVMHAWRALVS
jgi:DTW domain-containing protein YfiP